MEDGTFSPFLRIEKEDIRNVKSYKLINRPKLRTTSYSIAFFYKPITRLVKVK